MISAECRSPLSRPRPYHQSCTCAVYFLGPVFSFLPLFPLGLPRLFLGAGCWALAASFSFFNLSSFSFPHPSLSANLAPLVLLPVLVKRQPVSIKQATRIIPT